MKSLPDDNFSQFDLLQCGFARLNRLGMITAANATCARMLGLNRAELTSGKLPFLTQVAPNSRSAFLQHLEDALACTKSESCELSLRDDANVETRYRLDTICSPDGDDALYITLTDLTVHRRLEEMYAQQKLLADAAILTKDLFFAMLSHELRTPLTPVLAILDDLTATPDRSEEERVALAIMRRNLELEKRLIDDLLDLTSISSRKLELDRQTADVHLCLMRAIGDCQPEIEIKKLQLALDLRATRYFVKGDERRLQQVFWNLITNAVKFAEPGTSLSIASSCDAASQLTVEFSDTGIGIDWWPLGRIFDPLLRGNEIVERRFRGLGLGLALSKAIVEAHGGTLTGASADDTESGATFRIELPAVCAPATESPDPAHLAPPVERREGLRLLLVEDHDDTRRVLERLLCRRGYHVEAAASANAARELCAQKGFDLLICDLGLPEVSGFELQKELAREHRLPGIALSGFGSDRDRAESEAAGFLDHLVKPVDARHLDTAIQRIACLEMAAAR